MTGDTRVSRTATRRRCGGWLLAACVAAGSLTLSAAELVDRVLAVVSGTVITLSDARIAMAFKAVDTSGAADPIAVTLRWLVDRQLVLDEVTRYDRGDIEPARVAAALSRLRSDYASDEAYSTGLDRLGLDPAGAHRWVEETLRMQDYLERRFDTMFPPTDDELLDYYTRNPARFTRGGTLSAFEAVKEDVRAVLQQQRQREAVESWLTRLRRRANVSELYQPAR
jgi:hypothetical protein